MPRRITPEPLGPDERRIVEEGWAAAQPAIRRLRRRHPRLDIEGWAAHILVRSVAIHRTVEDPVLWAIAAVAFAPHKAAVAERPAGFKHGGGGPKTATLDFEASSADAGDVEDVDAARGLLRWARPGDAELLWEHAVEGRSCAEIAAARGVTKPAVKWAIARAKRCVRDRLERGPCPA